MEPDSVGYPTTNMYPCLNTDLVFFQCFSCTSKNACATYEHLLGCPGGKINIARHNELIDLNIQQFNTVNIITIREPGPVSADTKKKTDIRATGYNLQPKHIDWAVISPNAQTYAQSASTIALYAANDRYLYKMGKHAATHGEATNVLFVPYIMESTGAFHPTVFQELWALSIVPGAENLPTHNAPCITNAYQYWASSYSIAVVRATSRKTYQGQS